MSKPNPARSVCDVLSANWGLSGDLSLANIDFYVEERATTQTNKPTILVQKGRRITHEEGLPVGLTTWVEQEVYIQPFMPTASGANDQRWSMSREADRIIRSNRTSASGIELMKIAPRSPRGANMTEPYRGNEVVITCFWREG